MLCTLQPEPRSEGILGEKIRTRLCQWHFPGYYNLRIVSPNTSHIFKAGPSMSRTEERGILLGALPPIVLPALCLPCGLRLCPFAAQGLSLTASPGDDLHPQLRQLLHNQFPPPHSVLPEACPQCSKVKARTI